MWVCFFGINFVYLQHKTKYAMDLKEYIRRDFYRSNLEKYRKYFEEWYENLTETQLEFWVKRMDGQIC